MSDNPPLRIEHTDDARNPLGTRTLTTTKAEETSTLAAFCIRSPFLTKGHQHPRRPHILMAGVGMAIVASAASKSGDGMGMKQTLTNRLCRDV